MKNLEFNSYPYIVKNNNYSTITFDIVYPYIYDQNHMFDIDLMRQIVMNSSYDYKTEQEFKIEKTKRLIIDLSFRKIRFHNNLFIIFTLTIPDPNKVKNFDINDALEFFYNTIYSPNIINNEFDNKQFDREKEYIKFSIENALKKIYTYGYQRFVQYVDDIGDLKNNTYNNLELIEKCTPKSSYEYYKDVVINNTPICIVYGDVNKEYVEDLYYKYFKKTNSQIFINKDYDCYLKPNEEPKYIEEVSNYNQSALYMAYKIENMIEEYKLFLGLLCNILNSSETNLIFKKLRSENNLMYSHKFERHIKKGMFFIEAYIDKTNKEKAISVIKELFDEINNIDLIKDYINKIIKGIEYRLIELKDSKYYELDKFTDNLFEFGDSLEDIYDSYKEINIEEFMKFLNRVKLDTIYFLRGESNEAK